MTLDVGCCIVVIVDPAMLRQAEEVGQKWKLVIQTNLRKIMIVMPLTAAKLNRAAAVED